MAEEERSQLGCKMPFLDAVSCSVPTNTAYNRLTQGENKSEVSPFLDAVSCSALTNTAYTRLLPGESKAGVAHTQLAPTT